MEANNDQMVSVIIPAYNYARYLGECLESVLGQSYKNWECIIVDNGSTDNTKEVAGRFVAKDKRFSYHFTEQSGVSLARNMAVALSKGAYILPLDADDKIASTYLEKGVAALRSKNKVKVVYCEARLFGAASGKWDLPGYSLERLLKENLIFCTALFRKKDFEQTRGYNPEMKEGFEDWDFWISLLKDGGEVYRIPEELFYYRIKEGSRNSVLDHDKQLRLRKQIFGNHKELYLNTFELHELIYMNYQAEVQLESIKKSRAYKVGKMLSDLFGMFRKKQ